MNTPRLNAEFNIGPITTLGEGYRSAAEGRLALNQTITRHLGNVLARVVAWFRRGTVMAELNSFDDRELADIGLSRSNFTQVFNPTILPASMPAAAIRVDTLGDRSPSCFWSNRPRPRSTAQHQSESSCLRARLEVEPHSHAADAPPEPGSLDCSTGPPISRCRRALISSRGVWPSRIAGGPICWQIRDRRVPRH